MFGSRSDPGAMNEAKRGGHVGACRVERTGDDVIESTLPARYLGPPSV